MTSSRTLPVADIHIVREHRLGMADARQLALRWAEVARAKLDMDCSYEEGEGADLLSFKRSGARGQLRVEGGSFELRIHLGLLLGVFRGRIEAEIVQNVDALLAQPDPLQAFEQGLAQHDARRSARAAGKGPARKAG
jgi:putative polyhydroxyalkanoate system protein